MFLLFLIVWLGHIQPFWTWICHHVLLTVLILLCLT